MSPDGGDAALALLRALEKLPPFTGIVFHGLPTMPDLSAPRWTRGLTATSLDPRVATENFSSPIVAAIVSRTGRALTAFSAHPGQQEVVLPPEVVLRTVGLETGPDGRTPLVVIEQLAELDPKANLPATLEGLVQEVKARLRDAMALPPVEISSPGKFTERFYFLDERA